MDDELTEEDLEKIEEDLLEKEEKERKLPMPVDGKSVFEIKKIKDKNADLAE